MKDSNLNLQEIKNFYSELSSDSDSDVDQNLDKLKSLFSG